MRARLKAGEQLSNPLAEEVADDGRAAEMYDIYCRVCHGVAGAGDGSVGLKYNPQPMDLTLPYVQQQTDGQLYYTITHGGVIMPSYRFAMSKEDRWRIVQYLRTGLLEEAARVAQAAGIRVRRRDGGGMSVNAGTGALGAKAFMATIGFPRGSRGHFPSHCSGWKAPTAISHGRSRWSCGCSCWA